MTTYSHSVRLPQTSQSSHSKRCDRELTTASPNPELCDYKGVYSVQYIHTYIYEIYNALIVEDDSNQKRGLLLGGGV